ncbi:MAG: RNA polymerase sigma factor [Thermoanaerobaculia bacterium]|nr:RNA polymerase sigma factor [Thermoanaerobaculia bacterium]
MNRRGEMSDEELVAEFLASDRRSESLFAELFRRRRRQIWAVCYRYFGTPQDADDLTQEVFFLAFRRLQQFRGEASFRTWLLRIGENVCKNELRFRSRRLRTTPVADFVLEEIADSKRSPQEALTASRSRRDLRRALAELTEKEVRILNLVANDFSYSELAEAYGISVSATKMRVLRARLRLREALASRDRGPTDHE